MYRGVMLDGTENWCKIWRKTDFCLKKIFVYRLINSNFILESKMAELNLQESFVSWQWRMIPNLNRNWHVSSKLTGWIFWHEHSKISKIWTWTGCFWPKYIMFELKKNRERGFMFDGTKDWCKIWRKTDFCF